MDFSSPAMDARALLIQEAAVCLFGLVFFFLWRRSRIVYFGLWSVAWLLRCVAAIFEFEAIQSGEGVWLAPYAAFELGFAFALIMAARAGFAPHAKDWRTVLRLALGRGLSGRIFCFSLIVLAVTFLTHALLFAFHYRATNAPLWPFYVQRETYSDFTLHCVLAFSAMAMWSETQIDRIRELNGELDQLRRETKRTGELDGLTGLQNQTALARRVESGVEFAGVVAVCDMDNFKDINDRFGHLVGDEILRNIGSLLHASIRHEDEAFRWGGDEFVILFLNQLQEVAAKRMAELEGRLHEFHVRGFGTLPMAMSWGTADARGRALRDALDEADQRMYAVKRSRASDATGKDSAT